MLDRLLLAVFLAWVVWLPLPFASVIDKARLPLVAVPLAILALAALVSHGEAPPRDSQRSRAHRRWSIGAALLLLLIAIQLIPLPAPILQRIDSESSTLWQQATAIAANLGTRTATAHPISIAPWTTARELFRLLALFAAFQSAAILIHTHARRLALAGALLAAAVFEIFYGINEAALRRYEIWGWKNKLIFNRVTGTFVNPNHFAHYLAIIIPMAIFLMACAWHDAAPGAPFGRRAALLIEKHILSFGVGAVVTIGSVAAILVASSRGALLALFGGIAIVTLIAMARSHTLRRSRRQRMKFAFGGTLLFVVVLIGLVIYLGRERTIARFTPGDQETLTLVGRTAGYETALGVWRRFPVFGSGAGTFANASGLGQRDDLEKLYDHAHNDYLEIAATTGVIGFAVACIALIAGYVALVSSTFGREAEGSFRHRAFQAAALMSITIAMVHAMIDFNFFIPANAATLAVIAGASVGLRRGARASRPQPAGVPPGGDKS